MCRWWLWLLALAFAVSCGAITSPDDDDDDVVTADADPNAPDAPPGTPDARPPGRPDAEPAPDAPPERTHCGKTSCNRATQVCVYRSGPGPALLPSCEPLPEGCEADRTCDCLGEKLCTDLTNVCVDEDADNTIVCECPLCG